MMGIAIGQIGMSLKDFYSLTYNEYHYISKSYMYKDEREWIRTRLLASLLINVQMPKDKVIKAEDLFSLPSDNLIKVKKQIPTRAEFEEAIALYRKDKKDKKD